LGVQRADELQYKEHHVVAVNEEESLQVILLLFLLFLFIGRLNEFNTFGSLTMHSSGGPCFL
jgi:hypothetical protein